jgi:tetratricopeptide (TPR) repeat protein
MPKYDDAISNFNKAIGLDPQDSTAWYYKAMALTQESKIKKLTQQLTMHFY